MDTRALSVKFDGIDGCGKTSLIECVRSHFASELRVFVTREFGSCQDVILHDMHPTKSISQVLAGLAKSKYASFDDLERELIWIILSRRTNRIILPRVIKENDLVLVDRSNLGNICYGTVIDARLRSTYSLFTDPLEQADIIFWIDTPVEVCDRRLKERERDVIESKGIEFFRKVREEFYCIAQVDSRVVRLDGNKSLEDLTQEAINIIESKRSE